MTTLLPHDWSIHEARPATWPRSRDRVFMAEAVRQLGYVVHELWQGEEPRWANQQPWPLFHSHTQAFREGEPVAEVYEEYEPLVRSILSPAAFQARQMQDEIASFDEPAEVDLLVDPQQVYRLSFSPEELDRAIARATDGSDINDPITPEHWAFVWALADERRANYAAAGERLPLVAGKLLELTLRGSLTTFARPLNGGQSDPLPVECWEVDSALPRMARCGINIENPLDSDAPMTHLLFVDAAELHRIVGAAAPRPSSSPHPPRRQGSASDRERLKEEALIWLLKKVEDTIHEPWWDSDLYHTAMTLEPELEHLPDADWKSNWSEVFQVFRHIGRPGNRPKPPPGWSVLRSSQRGDQRD